MKMEQRLRSIYNMNFKKIFPLSLITFISACSQTPFVLEKRVFPFDSYAYIKLFEGDNSNLMDLANIFNRFDELSDNYLQRTITNVFSINQSNDEVQINKDLYDLLKISYDVKNEGVSNYNILCGSLSKKWKESLNNGQILDENIVNDEINKINNSDILFKDNYVVQRLGEAEIDLGGIVKGYVLDMAQNYLKEHNLTSYLIDAGMSSILLGEKKPNDGYFNVDLTEVGLKDNYIKMKNCFVSTSGVYRQGKTINGITYSHIVNPVTGSVINENDAVIVISDKGYFGDAMSTSLMMNTVEEIKQIEIDYSIKTLVIKDKKIIYQNKEIEVFKF